MLQPYRPGRADHEAVTQPATTKLGSSTLSARRRRHDDVIIARLERLSPYDRALLAAAAPALRNLTESHAN